MSRTPVRDALLMLESEGLIVRVGRLGVQIKQMRIEEFLDALEVRKLLEPTICQIAAGRVNCNALKELEIALSDALKMISTSGDGLDRATTRWIDDTLHSLIADTAGNAQLSAIVMNMRRKTQIFDLKTLPERAEASCKEHLEIILALRDGDGAKAKNRMKEHLDQIRTSIITRLSRP